MSITILHTKYDEPDLVGKTVARVERGTDSSGYGFARLTFTDGTSLHIHEEGQCGSISYEVRKP